jgi:hypothetical protein
MVELKLQLILSDGQVYVLPGESYLQLLFNVYCAIHISKRGAVTACFGMQTILIRLR